MGMNLSDPCVLYKSLRHLVDAATTHYLELFQITVLLYESGLLLRVIQISVKVCIGVTLYDEPFCHVHNRETYPYSTKDNFDRCPVIYFLDHYCIPSLNTV